MTGFAYDAAYPNMAAIMAKHPLIVCAYTDGPHGYTAAQVATARAGGAAVLANHERAQNELLGGAAAGKSAATAAVAGVLSWGMPANGTCVIVYSVDINAPLSTFPAIGKAFDAINAVHAGRFLADCYGEGALIDYLMSTGRIRPGVVGWLSASKSFPGYNEADQNVGLIQRIGSDVPGTDLNTVTNAAGLHPWWPDGHAPDSAKEDMPYLVKLSNAGTYVVADGETSRTGVMTEADLDILLSPPFSYQLHPMSDAQIMAIPEAGVVQAATLAALNAIVTVLADPAHGVLVRLATLQALAQTAAAGSGSPPPPSGTSTDLAPVLTALAAMPADVRAAFTAAPLNVTLDAMTGRAA